MSDRYLVVGNPIQQSKSPFIHGEFARMSGEDLVYDRLQIELDKFADTMAQLFADGLKGANVTVPFKEQAYRLADECSVRATTAGAANTLKRLDDGRLFADNTDGIGLVTDLTVNHSIELNSKNILILGAGGAVRGVLHPILQQQPAKLVIANRTVAKAQLLADLFAEYGDIDSQPYETLEGHFDLIINGTSASLHGDLPPIPLAIIHRNLICYDMMYGADDTRFNAWAKSLGAKQCIDGLGMLVEQAAESFRIWRDIKPKNTAEVIQMLRARL